MGIGYGLVLLIVFLRSRLCLLHANDTRLLLEMASTSTIRCFQFDFVTCDASVLEAATS